MTSAVVPRTVARETSALRRARCPSTVAPSMPTKTHIMTIRQSMICPPVPSRAASPLEVSAFAPQMSKVKVSERNTATMVAMKTKIGTSLQTITIALTALARSTPRFTSQITDQVITELSASESGESPPENTGRKYPSAEMNITLNATTPIQVESQYPQPQMKPTKGPKPSRAYATMPLSPGFSTESLPKVVASPMKPAPVISQAMRAGPGAAAREMSAERAKTPDPIEELMTRAMRAMRAMPGREEESAAGCPPRDGEVIGAPCGGVSGQARVPGPG